MIEYIDIVIKQILNNFDFGFMLTANLVTFYIIKVIDYANGEHVVKSWTKRLILVICVIVLIVVYTLFKIANIATLIHSAVVAPVFWDWILRPIFIKFGIGYKSIDDTMN